MAAVQSEILRALANFSDLRSDHKGFKQQIEDLIRSVNGLTYRFNMLSARVAEIERKLAAPAACSLPPLGSEFGEVPACCESGNELPALIDNTAPLRQPHAGAVQPLVDISEEILLPLSALNTPPAPSGPPPPPMAPQPRNHAVMESMEEFGVFCPSCVTNRSLIKSKPILE